MAGILNKRNNRHRKAAHDRKFYHIDFSKKFGDCDNSFEGNVVTDKERALKLMNYIHDNIIGDDYTFHGPYGERRVSYLDYTASGKALTFLERYIADEVLPCYGNTHTTTSVTSLQTTLYRHEARDIIRAACNASEHDVVIFAGSGCTGAVNKLIHGLNLNQAPLIFVGPFEHHSNLLPWREIAHKVIRIAQTTGGTLCLRDLEQQLRRHQSVGRPLIGCFSAASNVTGILTDTDQTSALLHKYGALALWDYAAGAPYLNMDMNPVVDSVSQQLDASLVYKDAIFFSLHKFVGGPQTPGVLIAKRQILINPVPLETGGGTVFYVTRKDHTYHQNAEVREEGGTPAIVESIRGGLVVQLKEAIGSRWIMEREDGIARLAMSRWSKCKRLILLGSQSAPRLPIFSFLVSVPELGTYLHYNFVCALLNDLYGIQARGGCACAGPYAQDLLGIDDDLAQEIEDILKEDHRLDRIHLRRRIEGATHREILRPGFARINLPYFLSADRCHFVIQALVDVARRGWQLLPQYLFNPETGEWKHYTDHVFKDRKWLGGIRYGSGEMTYNKSLLHDARLVAHSGKQRAPPPRTYEQVLAEADRIYDVAKSTASKLTLSDQYEMFDEVARRIHWFALPSEAWDILCGCKPVKLRQPAFTAAAYPPYDGNDGGLHEVTQNLAAVSCKDTGPCKQVTDTSLQVTDTSLQVTDTSQKVSDTSQEVTDSSQEATGASEEVTDMSQEVTDTSQEVTDTSQEVISTSQEVTDTSQEIARTSEEVTDTPQEGLVDYLTMAKQEDSAGAGSTGVDPEQGAGYLRSFLSHLFARGYTSGGREVAQSDSAAHSPTTTTSSRSGSPVDEDAISSYESALSSFSEGELSVDYTASARETCQFHSASISDIAGGDAVATGGDTDKLSPSVTDEVFASGVSGSAAGDGQGLPGAGDSFASTRSDTGSTTAAGHHRWHAPPKVVYSPFLRAVREYDMIRAGDRVMVCLSGGKDSLSLLHTLRQYQQYGSRHGIPFTLSAVTIDPVSRSYNPRPLIPYLATLGVPYFYEEQRILEQAANLPHLVTSICSFCSRMKRGRIYAAARREGYNVLALGQHLDDLAESLMMSLFHNGCLHTMKAHYTVHEGDLRVIRPFVYAREKHLRQFAESRRLPVIAENCPACFEAPKERQRMKQLLAAQEIMFPKLFNSVCAAMRPLMAVSEVSGSHGQAQGGLPRTGSDTGSTSDNMFQ